MSKSPAFQFYVQDFLVGTMLFSAAEIGSYILLLCHQWDNGNVPEDEIEFIARTPKENLVRVLKKFSKTEHGLQNKRMEIVRKEQEEFRKRQTEKGKAGAAKRWGNDGTGIKNDSTGIENNGTGIFRPLHGDGSSSSSSSSNKKLSREKVFELLRGYTNRNTISDRQIHEETALFMEKYEGKEIGNLGALVNTWAGNIKPEKRKGVVI